MTDLVYDYISTGVDMILMAAILSSIVVLLRSSMILSSYQADLTANSDRMNYYRQYNMYDNTDDLCSADVVSALIFFCHDHQLVVNDTDGRLLVRNNTNDGTFYFGPAASSHVPTGKAASDYEEGDVCTTQQLGEFLRSDWTWNAQLFEDGSSTGSSHYSGGIVTGIKFKVTGTTH